MPHFELEDEISRFTYVDKARHMVCVIKYVHREGATPKGQVFSRWLFVYFEILYGQNDRYPWSSGSMTLMCT